MSRNLLLEIGTEEVPAHVMPGILKQLKEHAEAGLKELRLEYDDVQTMGTPRRSALIVRGLAERQEDVTRENRGPSTKIAFDADGNPSKAAQGFARGQKVSPEDLVQKDGYVYAIVNEKGQDTSELLKKLLPDLICGLSFPNNMRWGDLDFKFIRPIRWIVALYGDDVIPFEVAEVTSSRRSRGHRFLGHDFDIANAASYEKACEEQFVIVDQERRKEIIRKGIVKVADDNGGHAEISEELLEEVLYLVEYPTALCGHFDEKYLKLPPEAVITPMRDHQRYFPVKDDEGNLMPLFITVRNGGSDYLDVVQHGNERVLRARLEDAQFFFDDDRKTSLESHLEKLKTVVFQDGLGTLYDKSCRLEKLSGEVAEMAGASVADKVYAMRAGKLAKADLVTGMVTEFTELQGVMGRSYAELDGEPKEVSQAIDEHYMPRFADDGEPGSVTGRIVSIADKIDTITGSFSRGLIPTGSQDPFALRRQALGIVRQIIGAKWHLSISRMVAEATDLYGINDPEERAKIQKDVADFMRLRMKNVLSEQNVRYDVADAVLPDVDDIYAVIQRAEAVAGFVTDGTASIQSFVRTGNLAEKAADKHMDEALFDDPAEKELYSAYRVAAEKSAACRQKYDFAGAIDALSALHEPIDKFFDSVMVMDKNEDVRHNRLALLAAIDCEVKKVADFDKIVIA